MVEVAEVENLEFKWGKKRGIGGKKKDVQFYESFTYDGVEYTLYDSVYLYKEEESEPYIGKLIKIWENADKSKKVKVLWFFRPSEISNFLGNDHTLENELFLACGEGVGLANVNPLEAIAGKCNVICTSKDSRNPQPSDDELQMSDFFFCRTFDVGLREILDKIDEKIAGIEVKFIFNRVGCQKSSGVFKLGSDKKEVGMNAITSDEKVISAQQNIPEGLVTTKSEGVGDETSVKEHAKASVVKQKSSIIVKAASGVDVESSRRAKASERLDSVSTENFNLRSKVNENVNSKVSLVKQEYSLEEKPISGVGGDLSEVANAIDRQEDMSSYKTGLLFKLEDNADSKASLVRQKSTLGEKVASREGAQIDETVRTSNRLENILGDKVRSSFKVEFEKSKAKGSKVLEVKEEVKSTKDPGELDKRPFKKAKLNSSLEICDDNIKNSAQKLGHDSDGIVSNPTGAIINSEDKSKTKVAITKCSLGIDKGIFRKPKVDEKHIKPNNVKLTKALPFRPSNIENKTDQGVLEITRRPNFDRRKWFKELPWEERMRVAHEQGTLVLLENLDPSYTSTEVEDIVWHAFKENCSAKMIQRIASSSPHYGQAYAIFKTREAAEMVVTKLDEGCLLLSNGRPLVGSFRSPYFMGKQSTFFGHLVIDKLKFQMQREMREAVSTSHCSQPNTLEYDMAIEWCLLQEKLDCAWKKLHAQQGQELRKLGAGLKTK